MVKIKQINKALKRKLLLPRKINIFQGLNNSLLEKHYNQFKIKEV